MRKKTKNKHGGFGLQVLMLLFLLLVGANGAYAQGDCSEYEGSDKVITGLTETGRAASSLTIPATVTTVNSGAFNAAANVSTLIIEAGGNPTFEGKLFGDDKTNRISEIQILGNSMTVANIQKLFTSLGAQGALTTVYIAGYRGEWSDIATGDAVLTSDVTVALPAALVRAQKFGDAKVYGRFEITKEKEIISFCGNATFQDTDNGSNMLFYIADECDKEDGYIHIKRVSYVKKGEGVLIHNLRNTSAYADLPVYDGEITGDDATNYLNNMLKGVTEPTRIEKTDGDKTNLVLKDGAFHPTSGGTIVANKAYLQVPTTALAAREMLTLSFEEDPTGIVESEELRVKSEESDDAWYDLSGRLLNSRPSAKGLYIYNGKKYVIR